MILNCSRGFTLILYATPLSVISSAKATSVLVLFAQYYSQYSKLNSSLVWSLYTVPGSFNGMNSLCRGKRSNQAIAQKNSAKVNLL